MPLLVPDKVNMNYANMIEEGHLKKGFIIATLVSTLVGTFAASHNLWEKFSGAQKKKDGAQDEKIKKLTEELETVKKQKQIGPPQDELQQSLGSSGSMIRREFDLGFNNLGQRFAIGDLLAENQLQAQIIMIQQTVISVLEDALHNGRQISRADVARLTAASQSARDGSLDALRGQYQRLLQDTSSSANRAADFINGRAPERLPERVPRALPPPETQTRRLTSPPVSPNPGTSSSKRQTGRSAAPLLLPAAPSPPPSSAGSGGLFCRYSLDLQRSPRERLVAAFDPGRESRCPACRARLDVDSDDMFEISLLKSAPAPQQQQQQQQQTTSRKEKPAGEGPRGRSGTRGSKEEADEQQQASSSSSSSSRRRRRRFRVPARFVVKCHTESGEYACVLCCDPRAAGKPGGGSGGGAVEVVLCADPEALVAHVARAHEVAEIEREGDILDG